MTALQREEARTARLSRRQFLAGTAGGAAAFLGLGSYAWWIEPHLVEFVERPLGVPGLPSDLADARLALLADLHVGPYVSDDYLLDVFRGLAALEPDIVALAGDLTSHHEGSLEQAEEIYARLPRGRLATVAVLGNHDYGEGWADGGYADALTAVLEGLGIDVLRNEAVDVGGLRVVGMDDLWAGRFQPRRALAALGASGPALVLSHNPDTVDLEGWEGFSGWVLAGHTHGGQVRLPILPPPRLPLENRRYVAGEYQVSGGRRLYVSRGVGHLWIKARFLVRPEVTLFTLKPVGDRA